MASVWTASGVFAAGLLISIAVFAGIRSRERASRRVDFERAAAHVALTAKASFDVPLEVLRSVPAFYGASTEVTRDEFRRFVSGALARYPWIYALEWIPRVPGGERARHEQAAQRDGLAGYHFKQDAPPGAPVPADPRPEYFPLFYMEPPNPVALGIEETALASRRLALETARDLGTTVMTERLRLVQDDPSVSSVIAFHPIYRQGEPPRNVETRRSALVGFAAAVFRVRPVLEGALSGADLDRLDVSLADVDARPPAILYESRAGAEVGWEHVVTIAGRRWSIRVGDRGGWTHAREAGLYALALGLLASALASALAYATDTMLYLRRQVRAVRRLGQYTLVERLGEGGMGTVYRAHHAFLRRPTAIKLLHPTRKDASALARFEREVQLTSALNHPNTVVVYDYGHSPEGVFYYAMEYIEGITLQELVDAAGRQSAARVIHVLDQICAALSEAHAVGLVHRDIKPANIMLCQRGGVPDFVKVLDFGLAKDLSDDESPDLSRSTALIGTPLYVAPEVALRREIDARVDIYAVGAVAYFMLTATPVFTGNTVLEVCIQHMSTPPEPITDRIGHAVEPVLEALVLRCLAKDPAERPASVVELRSELDEIHVAAWGEREAKRWWNEHGAAVQEKVHSARVAKQRIVSEQTLEIDHERHERSETLWRAEVR
jgi:CHASE1-domain containing sensor protein